MRKMLNFLRWISLWGPGGVKKHMVFSPPSPFNVLEKSMCPMILIFFFERVCVFPENKKSPYMMTIACLENFLSHDEVWRFWKSWHLSEYSNLTLSFIFSKSQLFNFSWHRFGLMCRAVTIFLLTQRTRSGAPFRSLKKSFSPKNQVFSKYSNLTLSFIFQNLAWFFVLKLFSKASRNFSLDFTYMFNLPERCAWPSSLRQ